MKRTKTDRTVIILTMVGIVAATLAIISMLFYVKALGDEIKALNNSVSSIQEEEKSVMTYKNSFLIGGKFHMIREILRNNTEIPTSVSVDFSTVYVDLYQRTMHGEEIPVESMSTVNDILCELGIARLFPEGSTIDPNAFYDGMMYFLYDEVIQQLYLGGYIGKEEFSQYGENSDRCLAKITPNGVRDMLEEMEDIVESIELTPEVPTVSSREEV